MLIKFSYKHVGRQEKICNDYIIYGVISSQNNCVKHGLTTGMKAVMRCCFINMEVDDGCLHVQSLKPSTF